MASSRTASESGFRNLRESLTVLAGIVVLILSAALAVPYLVDWSSQRGLVERQLSEVLGRPVTIRGGIDLKLLPTPYLRLADVDLGSAAAKPEVKAAEIQLEIALTPLLRGEVDFAEAKLVHPQVALTLEGGNLRLGPPLHGLSGAMRFERISVENGTLVVSDPEVQRNYRLDKISFSAEASSLTGPFKADGHFSYAGTPTRFRLGTGDLARGDRLHIKLILDENAQHPRADVDADLQFAKESLPSLDGQMTLAKRDDTQMPWQLSAHVKAALRQASLDTIDLRIGDEDHGFDLAGGATVDFGAKPDAHAVLKAGQIDLDRLLSRKNGPTAMQRLADAGAALIKSNGAAPSAMPIRLEIAANTVLLGGETLSHLTAAVGAAGKQALALRFDGNGPGRSHLSLDGKLEAGDAAGFTGHIAARASDAQRLKRWLAAGLPQTAARLAALPVQSFDVSGDGNISVVGFVGQNLTLALDQTHLAGTLAYTQSVGSEPSRLFADLTSDRLDLASVPDIEGFATRAGSMDLSLRLDARTVNIGSLGQAHPGQGLATGRIQLRLEKSGKIAKLEQFAVTSLGGANVAAHGQWDGQTGTIAATLDSDKLAAAAELLQRLAPGAWSDLLSARANVLAPAHLTLSANVAETSSGNSSPGSSSQGAALQNADLGGTIGGTKVSAQVTADSKDPQSLDIIAMASAPDVLALLRQFGVATLPLQKAGSGEIRFSASGKLGESFASKIAASLAGTDIVFDGDLQGDLAAPQARGTLHLTSADLTGLLEATGLAFPDPSVRFPADVQASLEADKALVDLNHVAGHIAGAQVGGHIAYDVASAHLSGGLDTDHLSFAQVAAIAFGPLPAPKQGALWSAAKFTPAMLDLPPVKIAITAKSFDLWPHLVGHDARFDLDASGGRAGLKLALNHMTMKLASGSLGGDVTLRRDGANAAATARLKLADYDLALPSLRGRLAGSIDVAGTGDNPQALITSLAGSGALTVSDLVLPRTDPAALSHVLQAAEDDTLTLDGNEIERALAGEFDKGSAHLGTVAFDAGLAGGTLRLTPKETEAKRLDPGVAATLQMSLDTTTLTLDQKSHLMLVALPRGWSGPEPAVDLGMSGPLTNPVRTIQSAAFLNALAARAIARESARIQAQEFDIHEQAFFYNRLTFERRSEQERLRIIEEAKRAAIAKAEAEAKAKAEAAEKAKAAVEGRNPAEPSAAIPGAAKPEALHVVPAAHAEMPSATVQKMKPGEPQAKAERETHTPAPASVRPGVHAAPLHTVPAHSEPLHPLAHKPPSIVRRQPKPQAQTPSPARETPAPDDPLAAGRF